MNELIFFGQISLFLIFLFILKKIGKEGLIVFVAILSIFANLFIIKQIKLFGFFVTASDVYTVAMVFSLNLLQEYFGKKAAKKAANLSLILLLLFLILSKIHIIYIPSKFDFSQEAFKTIFSFTPRIIFSSIFVFFLMQRFDIYFYFFVNKVLKGKNFLIRNIMVAIVSQLLDTILFSFLALYRIVPNIFHVICLSFFIKICTITTFSIFLLIEKENQKKVIKNTTENSL